MRLQLPRDWNMNLSLHKTRRAEGMATLPLLNNTWTELLVTAPRKPEVIREMAMPAHLNNTQTESINTTLP
jgi:hypothetical protein